MNVAAVGWCKRVILLITILYSCGSKPIATYAEQVTQKKNNYNYNFLQINNGENYSSQSVHEYSCSKVYTTYSEIYSFETENYHINICQIENNFYYYRQSKLDINNSMLIPAHPVFGGKVFKAVSGKITYFVGKDNARHYSSVMLNNNEIVLEPELLPTTALFASNILDSGIGFSFAKVKLNDLNQTANVNWQTDSPENRNSTDSSICIKDGSILNPGFDNWHSLLGKSTDIANDYATSNGHKFMYDRLYPNQALIKTKGGKIVNLSIATNSKIIEQVCLQPTEDI